MHGGMALAIHDALTAMLNIESHPCRDYRVFLGDKLGQDLEGRQVDSKAGYLAAVAQLRTPEVRREHCCQIAWLGNATSSEGPPSATPPQPRSQFTAKQLWHVSRVVDDNSTREERHAGSLAAAKLPPQCQHEAAQSGAATSDFTVTAGTVGRQGRWSEVCVPIAGAQP